MTVRHFFAWLSGVLFFLGALPWVLFCFLSQAWLNKLGADLAMALFFSAVFFLLSLVSFVIYFMKK